MAHSNYTVKEIGRRLVAEISGVFRFESLSRNKHKIYFGAGEYGIVAEGVYTIKVFNRGNVYNRYQLKADWF